MGYYTSFYLTVTDPKSSSIYKVVGRETELAIAKKLCEISNEFDPSDINEYVEKSQYPLFELISSDMNKWYDHYDEMIILSKEFPSLYFELDGQGEDHDDLWKEYFHNGEGMHSDAKITFDVPNWYGNSEI